MLSLETATTHFCRSPVDDTRDGRITGTWYWSLSGDRRDRRDRRVRLTGGGGRGGTGIGYVVTHVLIDCLNCAKLEAWKRSRKARSAPNSHRSVKESKESPALLCTVRYMYAGVWQKPGSRRLAANEMWIQPL